MATIYRIGKKVSANHTSEKTLIFRLFETLTTRQQEKTTQFKTGECGWADMFTDHNNALFKWFISPI